MTRKSTVFVFGSFDGGDNGFDTLDLRAFGAARWSIDLNGASQNLAKAFDPDQTGVLSRGGSGVFTASIHDFEEILLGDGDNASIGRVFRSGDGADRFEQVAGDGVFHAGGGDDRLIVGDRGRAFSENGDDHISFDGQLNGHFASGGRGTDNIMAARMRGEAHGDAERNTLAFGPSLTAATADVQVNLRDGTALSVGATAGSANVRIDLAISGFEVLIGSHLGDDIVGAGRDEQPVGVRAATP